MLIECLFYVLNLWITWNYIPHQAPPHVFFFPLSLSHWGRGSGLSPWPSPHTPPQLHRVSPAPTHPPILTFTGGTHFALLLYNPQHAPWVSFNYCGPPLCYKINCNAWKLIWYLQALMMVISSHSIKTGQVIRNLFFGDIKQKTQYWYHEKG